MKSGHHKKTTIVLFFLLAILCIAGVELIACHYYDPTLFHKITDPVVDFTLHTAKTTVQTAEHAKDQFLTTLAELEEKRAAKAMEQVPPAETSSEENLPTVSEDITENQAVTPPLLTLPDSITDPAITELQTRDDQQILTGGPVEMVYFNQGDERWGNLYYGSDRINAYGCGPTAMAMVVSSMTDTEIDPPTMAKWAVKRGYWARRSGSYHNIVIGTATAYGLQAESFSERTCESLRNELLSGNLLVALMGPGHFTQGGHFIVLHGVTLSGDILVADPSSLERSLTAWDAQLILDELSKSTAHGSPLWLISPPASETP
ncbi:MAG: C39 family peptidase [Oscillospiraceae bacterium]|nr:C39 family peptidase [Oscillospiraceae bacterium]